MRGPGRSIAMCRRRGRAGVTLLEAIIALAIIGAAAVVCMQLRAQGFAQARAVDERRRAESGAAAILELASRGLLPGGSAPEASDPAQRVEWRGERDGAPFVCTREIVVMPNPAIGAVSAAGVERLAQAIALDRYHVEYEGAAAELLAPRGR